MYTKFDDGTGQENLLEATPMESEAESALSDTLAKLTIAMPSDNSTTTKSKSWKELR